MPNLVRASRAKTDFMFKAQAHCPALHHELRGTSPDGTARSELMRSEAGIHTVRWSSPVWRLLSVRRMVRVHIRCKNNLTARPKVWILLVFLRRDKSNGFQLYQSDPSGNYAGWMVSLHFQFSGKNSIGT